MGLVGMTTSLLFPSLWRRVREVVNPNRHSEALAEESQGNANDTPNPCDPSLSLRMTTLMYPLLGEHIIVTTSQIHLPPFPLPTPKKEGRKLRFRPSEILTF